MVHIRNSLLTGSTQGIYGALYLELISNPWLLLIIENSVISNNIMTDASKLGVGMTVYIPALGQDPIITLRNVSFLNNERYGGIHSAIIVLYYANNVTFTDCKFHGNRGTAIGAYQSTFYMNGYLLLLSMISTAQTCTSLLARNLAV